MTQQEALAIQARHPDNLPKNTLSPVSSMTPEMAQQIQEQNPIKSNNDSGNYPLAESLGRNTAAILGSAGRDIINTPRNLLNLVPGVNNQNNPLKSYEPNYDYYHAMGVQPSTAKSIAQGAVEFGAPLGIAKGVGMLGTLPKISEALQTNALAGGLGGAASTPDNAGTGFGIGTGLGVLAHAGGLAGSAAASVAANLYAKSALPGLVSRATSAVKNSLIGGDDIVAPLKNAHDSAVMNETTQWANANNKAADLDNNLMRPDPSPYLDYINNYIKEKSALEPAIRAGSEEALDYAKNNAMALTPQSYQGAVSLRQGLNENIQDYLKMKNKDAPSRGLNNFVTGLKSTLNDVVNPENSPPQVQDFYKSWEDANNATQRKQQFYMSPDKNGTLQYNPALQKTLKSDFPDASVINEFSPKPSQTGTSGIDHLSNLVGDKDTASNMVNSYMMRQLPQSGAATKTASDYYSKLSPQQRTALFQNNPADPYLKTANDVMLNYGKDVPNPTSFGRDAYNVGAFHFLPAIAGYGAGQYSGLNPQESAALGLGLGTGSVGLRYATRKAPISLIRGAMNYGRQPAQNPGSILNPALNSINYGTNHGG